MSSEYREAPLAAFADFLVVTKRTMTRKAKRLMQKVRVAVVMERMMAVEMMAMAKVEVEERRSQSRRSLEDVKPVLAHPLTS